MNKYINIMAGAAVFSMALSACADEIEMRYPPKFELPELPVVENVHKYKAPLYWSVYEYCYTRSEQGIANEDMDINAEEWDRIIDWVSSELKPYGYDMICTDGFIPMLANDESGYMTHYGSMSIAELVQKCKAKGLRLGVYDNPLWIHGSADTPIEGTDYTFQNLFYNGSNEVMNPGANDNSFWWAVAENPGCREYIDGFFKHYHDLGVEYIRMDFLSWYEDGKDRNMGIVGRGYGRASYARALAYIAESAQKYGIFTSLVMPHLYDDAILEAQYGNMVRIVADTGGGGWWHCSAQDRGKSYTTWPNCMNMFDGFLYWSHIAGRDKVILDGDFIRLNTFDTDAERETVVSLQLMAGGPVTVADQYSTIGNHVRFYTNEEMLALNADRFVGRPLDETLGTAMPVWHGEMSDGTHIVGVFNRDDNAANFNISFADLGLSGEYIARDLWARTEVEAGTSVSGTIQPHGCKIYRLRR